MLPGEVHNEAAFLPASLPGVKGSVLGHDTAPKARAASLHLVWVELCASQIHTLES